MFSRNQLSYLGVGTRRIPPQSFTYDDSSCKVLSTNQFDVVDLLKQSKNLSGIIDNDQIL